MKLIWLDDLRDPFANPAWLTDYSPLTGDYETIWLKSYAEFVGWINANGLPDGICFDHDLADEAPEEKTGYDCAKWLVDYCLDHSLPLPKWDIQSSNPPGRLNISKLFESYTKHFGGL